MPQLTLSHLDKRFGSHSAVTDLSLQVAEGQRLVILGPSGCGKTTTLRLIAGLEVPDRGAIRLGERELGQVAPARRGIAMVFQDAALYPHLSVRENLSFALRSQRLAAQEITSRVDETAAGFEITELLDRYPASLSGGQRSRVACARAMVKRPDVLLLDEPLTGLDPPLRWQLQNVLLSWHRRFPTTTIHVTHDQQEAMLMGDQVAVMRAGALEQIAAPIQLYRQPVNRFVASFIGSPGMNFASGRLVAGSLHIDQLRITPPRHWETAEGPVDVGARPEAIALVAETAGQSDNATRLSIHGVVESVRPTGARRLVAVAWSGNLWWVSCPEEAQFGVGEHVRMLIEPSQLHGFPSSREPQAARGCRG